MFDEFFTMNPIDSLFVTTSMATDHASSLGSSTSSPSSPSRPSSSQQLPPDMNVDLSAYYSNPNPPQQYASQPSVFNFDPSIIPLPGDFGQEQGQQPPSPNEQQQHQVPTFPSIAVPSQMVVPIPTRPFLSPLEIPPTLQLPTGQGQMSPTTPDSAGSYSDLSGEESGNEDGGRRRSIGGFPLRLDDASIREIMSRQDLLQRLPETHPVRAVIAQLYARQHQSSSPSPNSALSDAPPPAITLSAPPPDNQPKNKDDELPSSTSGGGISPWGGAENTSLNWEQLGLGGGMAQESNTNHLPSSAESSPGGTAGSFGDPTTGAALFYDLAQDKPLMVLWHAPAQRAVDGTSKEGKNSAASSPDNIMITFAPGTYNRVFKGVRETFPWSSTGNDWLKGQRSSCYCGYDFLSREGVYKRPATMREHLANCPSVPKGPLKMLCQLQRDATRQRTANKRQQRAGLQTKKGS